MSSTPLLPPVEEPEPERRPTAELGPQSAARASAVASGDVAMLRMRWFWGAAYPLALAALVAAAALDPRALARAFFGKSHSKRALYTREACSISPTRARCVQKD